MLTRVLSFSTVLAASAAGQVDSAATLRGVVRAANGTAVEAANVFLLETLEGALTDTEGRFALRTARRGPASLVVRRIGFRSVQLQITLPATPPIEITLAPEVTQLALVTVQAGRYTAGDERGATLTSLEVVTTPGAAANVNRAIQTLPGTQAVDEGTALFVRGGDYTETKVLLDGAPILNSTQLRTPTGTFTGTVDPFLLDGIFFSSGGFGARYGNALSSIVSLRTQGRPERTSATASAGLAALSGSIAVALPRTTGIRAAGNRLDLTPFFRVNGSPREYDPPPTGHDLSGSATWSYRQGAELKLFAIDQRTRLGVGVDEASFGGLYNIDVNAGMTVLTWRDAIGGLSSWASLSTSQLDEHEEFGVFRLGKRLRSTQLSGMAEWPALPNLTVRAGGELERTVSSFDGSIPERGDDVAPGARTTVFRSDGAGDREGIFAEAEWRARPTLIATTGVRTDHSELTEERTIDPRVSLALSIGGGATVTAAWGVYHQVPDPMFLDPEFGDPSLPSMRATQSILGVQVERERLTARVELYDKRYRDLALLTRDNDVVAGGTGRSRGADVWLKGRTPLGIDARVAYSLVSARRTDGSSGIVTHAPFDVTHSVTALAERRWLGFFMSSVAYRYATGRPFTPVTSATFDPTRSAWTPTYGPPMSERLPTFHRLDVSAAVLRRFGSSVQAVFFWSLSNALDRENVHTYRYSPDYSQRIPVRSLFNRAHYFGASLTATP
jgi:TonB-dependent receptor-like protein/carboxypeptidase-like protein